MLTDKVMEKKLKKIMADLFEVSINQINESTTSENIESWDSLKHIQLIVTLESQFSLKFGDEEILEMMNYRQISEIVANKLHYSICLTKPSK